MIKTYSQLTKPGIILGNLMTALAGFILASRGHVDLHLLLFTLIGLALIIASACVFNNYLDRTYDEKMQRTKNRALVTGSLSVKNALFFGLALGVLGSLILFLFTNLLTLWMALTGFFVYVILYSMSKPRLSSSTLIGSISGALPPVVGYTAVSQQLDLGALLVFTILVFWQMPHFFSIAMYRVDEYVAASIPVLPVTQGMFVTKVHMLAYIVLFAVATLLPTLLGFTGYAYLVTSMLVAITWFFLCLQGFQSKNDTLWARKMFLFSLVAITIQSVMISCDVL